MISNSSGKKYFAFIDGEQKGPYELWQLISAGVRPSTFVWCKDMADWQRADEVPDIRNLFLDHLSNRKETPQIEEPAKVVEADTPATDSEIHREEKRGRGRLGRYGIDLPDVDQINVDINVPPSVSMALAVASMFLCFLPTGIAAVFFTSKSLRYWQMSLKVTDDKERDSLRTQCHEYERQAKMWLGLTVAFGLIFWTIIISIFA